MKHNSTKQSLARKVTLKIVFVLSWLVIFPIIVMSSIIDIVAKKNSKVNANTCIVSDQSKIVPDQSKIVPKNTNDSLKVPKGIEER